MWYTPSLYYYVTPDPVFVSKPLPAIPWPPPFVPQPRPNGRMRHPALARCGFGNRLFSALGPIAPLWAGGGV